MFPGLGEWAAGERRRGLLAGVPAAIGTLAIGAIVVATWLKGGMLALGTLLLHPQVIVAAVVLDLFALVYRVASIVDAWRIGSRNGRPAGVGATSPRSRRVAAGGLAALLIATTVVQGAVAAVGIQAEDALVSVFPNDPGSGWSIPSAAFSPTPSPAPTATQGTTPAGPSASPTAAPTPTSTPVALPGWAADGRLNLLLVGSDAGTGRWSLRTDTMILLSVDLASGHAALFGIPRNVLNVPLPAESAGAFPNGHFPQLLNALYVYALAHPEQFPGGDARGFRAVTGAIQELVGVPLDGFVAVDLEGFMRLVDAVGGLWFDVPSSLFDDHYPKPDGTGDIVITIRAGCQLMSGTTALAYARSRHQDSDYGRMRRQQAILLALREQLDPLTILTQAPTLLGIVKDDLSTTIRLDDLEGLANLAYRVDTRSVKKLVFDPPTYPEFLTANTIAAIQDTVRNVFTGTWPSPESGGSSGSSGSCP